MVDAPTDQPGLGIALLRLLVEEVKAAAHDPATVHLVAEKLHHGIDALEKAIVTPDQPKGKA